MSEAEGTSVVATAVPVEVPAPKLTAIQVIEQEIGSYFKQKEQAIANLHAIDGAIQAGTRLLALLKAEAAKAEKAVESVVETVEAEVKKL